MGQFFQPRDQLCQACWWWVGKIVPWMYITSWPSWYSRFSMFFWPVSPNWAAAIHVPSTEGWRSAADIPNEGRRFPSSLILPAASKQHCSFKWWQQQQLRWKLLTNICFSVSLPGASLPLKLRSGSLETLGVIVAKHQCLWQLPCIVHFLKVSWDWNLLGS